MCANVCVLLCVCDRGREGGREGEIERQRQRSLGGESEELPTSITIAVLIMLREIRQTEGWMEGR